MLYFVGIHQLSKPIRFIDFCIWCIIHIPYVVLMGIGSIFANQIYVVSLLILDNKKEGVFPAMSWKDTISNMLILERWKK